MTSHKLQWESIFQNCLLDTNKFKKENDTIQTIFNEPFPFQWCRYGFEIEKSRCNPVNDENTAITTSTLDKVQLGNDLMNIDFDSITQQMVLYFENVICRRGEFRFQITRWNGRGLNFDFQTWLNIFQNSEIHFYVSKTFFEIKILKNMIHNKVELR